MYKRYINSIIIIVIIIIIIIIIIIKANNISEMCIFLHIIWKSDSKIVVLFTQKISRGLKLSLI